MIYFIIVFLILYLYLSIKRLDWSLMVLLFLLPTYLIRFKIGVPGLSGAEIPITLLEAMIWIVFIIWFYQNHKMVLVNLKNKFKINNFKLKIVSDYPFKWEMILLLIVSFIAAGISGFSNEALGVWKAYFFEPLLLFIAAFNIFGKNEESFKKKYFKMIIPLACSAFIISLFAVYQKITGHFIPKPLWSAEATRRVTSVFGYPNAVGLYLESIILLMVGFVISKTKATALKPLNDKWKIIFLVITILISILAIIFAKSVGASLGVGAGIICFALFANKKSRISAIIFLLVAAIGIATYQPARHQALKYLTLNDFSGQVRKAQWKETWEMLKVDNHWLWGSGLSSYQNVIKPFHKEGIFVKDYDDPDAQRKLVFNEEYRKAHWQPLEIYLYPHNIILNFWTELGLAGLLLFAWIIVKYLFLGVKSLKLKVENERYLMVGLICAMVVMVVHGLVDVPYFKNDLAVIFWILMVMMGSVNIKKDRDN